MRERRSHVIASQAFAVFIKHVGTGMVSDAERERTLVQDLLHFKEKLDRILSVAFNSNEQFGHSLKEAFESFINVRQVRRPREAMSDGAQTHRPRHGHGFRAHNLFCALFACVAESLRRAGGPVHRLQAPQRQQGHVGGGARGRARQDNDSVPLH